MDKVYKAIIAIILNSLLIRSNTVSIDLDFKSSHQFKTSESDDYVCKEFRLTNDSLYINHFIPKINTANVHHALLVQCLSFDEEYSDELYKCGVMFTKSNSRSSLCRSANETNYRILYVWAHMATELSLNDTAFYLKPQSRLVLQLHFKKAQTIASQDTTVITLEGKKNQPFAYIANVVVIFATHAIIPAKQKTNLKLICHLNFDDIEVIAYRIHGHSIADRGYGYKVSGNETWTLFGNRSIQDPQIFEPLKNPILIRRDDSIGAVCTFINPYTHPVMIGHRSTDEMCNFYLLYRTKFDEYKDYATKNYCASIGHLF